MLYQAKQSFNIEGGIKTIYAKQKLKQHMTTKSPLQKILKGILHTEDERMGIIKSQKKSRKVIGEYNKISCTHINPYTRKTTKLQELPHISQY
jgi:hypothetical protein